MKTPKSFWTYQAATETPDYSELPEGTFHGSRAQWEAFSPGMRREIVRSRHNQQTKNGESQS